ncbi:MAG: prepilin-type N-terminal cleavage/methylation domain-containing protein [Armatimonadota bacterium]|nr:prepilin-type N-terminal cleavage/methylation domain-containing protein [Armatimonadota bacterium]
MERRAISRGGPGGTARTAAPERGYTFIELVVVLSLVAVLMTLAAGSVRVALAREEADGWVRSLARDITAGQQAAFTRRASVTAAFQNRTYTITVTTASGSTVLRQDTLPPHMTFGSTLQSVTFNRRGVPNAALTLTVSSSFGRTYIITVEDGTGRVTHSES